VSLTIFLGGNRLGNGGVFYVTFFVVLHSDCYKGGYVWFRMM